ncbi:Glycine/D-amino acid oxidase [Filimonas lacunae]|uniref:Glycine/D-amino acid oxidase n=1 Tax=Filimonas lacunae TaxID=477680 RepID=A0A173MMT1_9BACT|nr:FAD-binding oxidoreductase [Filimonas lacunae]BAV08760.1 FAD dependent oxidoreductase [Filimonas lacunae]SIS61274.1 Glycine/D-amino acid oxidase [Filimonas lacunae]
MQVDYLIIGQGICGTFLSHELHQAGKKILVIDESQPFSSTKVASGVINPVTGRQVSTTWMAEELMSFTWQAYTHIGNTIGSNIIQNCGILAFPPSQQMREAYDGKMNDTPAFIHPVAATTVQEYIPLFHFFHGAVHIQPAYHIDLHTLLKGWRHQLLTQNSLLEESFDATLLQLHHDRVIYKDIQAEKIIFCNGTNTFQHPLWQKLPYSLNKGEALIADIPDLPPNQIYKFGITTLVPWYDGLWWVGSTYDNRFEDALPTEIFLKKKSAELASLVKCPYTIVDHIASIRPATVERRPFVGFHPQQPAAGIFNGMGTKGCSLAPYFAHQLAQHLTQNTPTTPAADVKRFGSLLSLS